MPVDPELLRALRDKYRQIKRMREEDAAGLAHDPRREMAELASRYPGALRELDELTMAQIEQRLAALERCCASAHEPAPDWAALQIGYHGWMRAVLRIKRLARGRGCAEAAAVLRELAGSYRPAPDEPPLERFDAAALCAVLEPPAGRLNPWVFDRVAAEHGVTPDRVRKALFSR